MATISVICINCAEVFSIKESLYIECPKCGYKIERKSYNELLKYCHDAARFGYEYRLKYEKLKLDEKRIQKRYKVEPTNIYFSFMALAALSGIVGGISYDIVKHVAKIVLNNAKRKRKKNSNLLLLESDKEFREFYKCIKEFHHDLKDLKKDIKNIILEEMFVHEYADLIAGNPKVRKYLLPNAVKTKNKDYTYYLIMQKELMEAKIKVIDNILGRVKPQKKELEKLWKKIP